ncbi:MAG: haloacid dehalogenase-like hydrolase [Hyphomicrobiales bacterium]|nr:haloacid dehalogenase-like hydrolase [Hyphomicrobiales bacterium]
MKLFSGFAVALLATFYAGQSALADPLPSWNDTEAKQRIIEFVETVSDPGSENYVTPSDRIAVFDNDGTLWGEQPLYFQLIYALDRLKQKAEADPSVLSSDVLKAAVEGDLGTVAAAGSEGLVEILNVTHAGLSVVDYQADVRDWLDTARHPVTGMAYDDMIYQPMLELLRYLRDEGFATYIVSGGGLHFMRVFAEEAYGIPPNQVIGSATQTSYEVVDGVPTVMKDGNIAFIDDKEGKPVGIDSKIGKRPILAGGNSDGDFQMLEWTTAGDGPRFGLIVHHTDGEREVAYDRGSHIGKLVRGLDEGPDLGWLIIDMAKDWAVVYPKTAM